MYIIFYFILIYYIIINILYYVILYISIYHIVLYYIYMYIYAFHEETFMSFMLYAICMCVFQFWVFLALQVNAGDMLDLPPTQ